MFFKILKTVAGRNLRLDGLLDPFILHLTVTNRCNSRCIMCNIWKNTDKADVCAQSLAKYRNSRLGRTLRILDITGGEPFLCDLPSVVNMLDNGRLKMLLVSTNGQLADKIERDVGNILRATQARLFIDVSIDGIGKRDDEIRGVKGKFESSLATIKKLKLLHERRLKVSWKFTILKQNIDQMLACFDAARDLNVEFTCKPAARYEFLGNQEMDFGLGRDDYGLIIENLIQISKKDREQAHQPSATLQERFFTVSRRLFFEKLIDYYRLLGDGRQKMIVPCYSTFLSLILHYDSGIYSCPTLMRRLGDIRTGRVEPIWHSQEIRKARGDIRKRKCQCYSQCDQMPSILLSNPHKLIWGILASYLKRGRLKHPGL